MNLIYRWKAEADAAPRDERAAEIEASGVRDPRDVRRILDLEDELEAYKKTVAEQRSCNDPYQVLKAIFEQIPLAKTAEDVERLADRIITRPTPT